MNVISLSTPDEATQRASAYFKDGLQGRKVVVTNAKEITERDFACGVVNPNADVIFWAKNLTSMLSLCQVLKRKKIFSADVQVVAQRKIGRDYASSLLFQNLDENGVALFAVGQNSVTV